MDVEAERLPMTSRIRKKQRIGTGEMTHLLVDWILVVQLVDQ